jgi:hypothetical protein
VAASEAEKAGHEMHMESVRRQKALLQRRVADHHAAADAAESELRVCAHDVAGLEKQVGGGGGWDGCWGGCRCWL